MAIAARGGVTETIRTMVVALLIAGVFRTLFYQPYYIPSGSMKDTLLVGDYLFINKMAYGYSKYSCPFSACSFAGRLMPSDPERGDVVVFSHPASGEVLVKRLIGLPGDMVQVRDGLLYVNGTAARVAEDGIFTEINLPQGPMADMPRCANAPITGGDCHAERSQETLPGGVTHDILNLREYGPADNTGVYMVPPGEFFMMGDNRDNSNDSRFPQPQGVGFVPFENLIGRADMMLFSSAGRSLFAFWTWRSDRFFKRVT